MQQKPDITVISTSANGKKRQVVVHTEVKGKIVSDTVHQKLIGDKWCNPK